MAKIGCKLVTSYRRLSEAKCLVPILDPGAGRERSSDPARAADGSSPSGAAAGLALAVMTRRGHRDWRTHAGQRRKPSTSTLTRSVAAAAALGAGALVVVAILSALPTIGDFTPGALLEPGAAWALGERSADARRPIAGTLVMVGAALGAAVLAFRRQEL